MSIIKSYSVGNGDMFCIRHNSNNVTIIDCCLKGTLLTDCLSLYNIKGMIQEGDLCRFVSTHPDDDHIAGMEKLFESIPIDAFYCVQNDVIKENPTESFQFYFDQKRKTKHYIFAGLKNCWLNQTDEERGGSGISFLWPNISDKNFQDVLSKANMTGEPNNISPIIVYRVASGAVAMWMGDLESDFLQQIENKVVWPQVDILFAPHHGRKSGKVPESILQKLDPQVVVIGEADSEFLNYYQGYNTITQNSAGDIEFECGTGVVHVYCGNKGYCVNYLTNLGRNVDGNLSYVGSFETRRS